ncbi:oligosaccharide flippase family protein [Thalassotalea ganghwensis]
MNLSSERKFGVILSYLSIALRNICSLILIPLIIYHVGKNQYGLYSLVTSLAGYLIILELGLSNTVIRFITRYQAKDSQQELERFIRVIFTIYSIVTMIVVVIGMLIWVNLPEIFSKSLTDSEIDTLKYAFAILILNVSITLMGNSFNGIISAFERFTFQKMTEIVAFLIRFGLVILLLKLEYGIVTIVVVDTLTNGLLVTSRIIYVLKKTPLKLVPAMPVKAEIQELSLYTLFIGINVIVNQVNWRVDTLIIGVLTDSVSLAVFNIGSQLILCFIAFASAISNIFAPKVMKLVANNVDTNVLLDEVIRIGRMQMFILGFALSAFIGFGQTFVQLFVGQEFEQAYWVALVTMVPFTFVLAQTSTNAILQALNKHKIRSLMLLATSLINILISIYLVAKVGIVGAAIGTAIALILGELILVNIYLIKSIDLNMITFYRVMLLRAVPVILLTSILAHYSAQFLSLFWWQLILFTIGLFIVYAMFAYAILLTNAERKRINQFCSQAFKRKAAS